MKVAIITGASRGIGRAIAYAMAGKDVYIAICGRNEEAIRLVTEQQDVQKIYKVAAGDTLSEIAIITA